MGKTKKARIPFYNHHDNPARKRVDRPASGPATARGAKQQQQQQKQKRKNDGKGKSVAAGTQQQHQQQQKNRLPVIPFRKSDRILLIGEGDFSFATSLINHHGCKNVLATCYDQEQVLYEKYPQTREYIQNIVSAGSGKDESSSSASIETGRKRKRDQDDEDEDEGEGEDEDEDVENHSDESASAVDKWKEEKQAEADPSSNDDKQKTKKHKRLESLPNILFGIDARKLGSGLAGGAKTIKNGFPRPTQRPGQQQQQWREDGPRPGPWDVICFNFPHVGGLSKDVNRQVRANQDLLVSFFKVSAPLLSAPPPEKFADEESEYDDDDEEEEEDYGSDIPLSEAEDETEAGEREKGVKDEQSKLRTEPGQILVTLFEGEPYTLWNIRDLARHAGLRVVTSFKFPWTSYPGYSHARTIGEIEGKHGGRGGWRGEDREARTYVFERKEWEGLSTQGASKRSRRKKGKDDGDDDSD